MLREWREFYDDTLRNRVNEKMKEIREKFTEEEFDFPLINNIELVVNRRDVTDEEMDGVGKPKIWQYEGMKYLITSGMIGELTKELEEELNSIL